MKYNFFESEICYERKCYIMLCQVILLKEDQEGYHRTESFEHLWSLRREIFLRQLFSWNLFLEFLLVTKYGLDIKRILLLYVYVYLFKTVLVYILFEAILNGYYNI